MDCKYIEQLLERYWQCETSLEEEAQLRAFFNGSDVPEHLLRYKDLFVYQQLQQEVGLGDSGGEGKTLDAYRTFHSAVQGRRSSGSGTFIRECDATFIL